MFYLSHFISLLSIIDVYYQPKTNTASKSNSTVVYHNGGKKLVSDCSVTECWSCINAEKSNSTCVDVRCTPCYKLMVENYDEKQADRTLQSGGQSRRISKRAKTTTDINNVVITSTTK